MPTMQEVQMATKSPALRISVTAAVAALMLMFVTAAYAGKGPGPKQGGGGGGGSFNLVLLNSTDGVPHWGQQVTFAVSTTATTEPHVSLKCYQGVMVYTTQTGYYASYPWPWTQIMTLSSLAWSSGAADCASTLYYFKGTRTVTLATLNFHVYA